MSSGARRCRWRDSSERRRGARKTPAASWRKPSGGAWWRRKSGMSCREFRTTSSERREWGWGAVHCSCWNCPTLADIDGRSADTFKRIFACRSRRQEVWFSAPAGAYPCRRSAELQFGAFGSSRSNGFGPNWNSALRGHGCDARSKIAGFSSLRLLQDLNPKSDEVPRLRAKSPSSPLTPPSHCGAVRPGRRSPGQRLAGWRGQRIGSQRSENSL